MNIKRLLLVLTIFTAIGTSQTFAQSKKKAKTKTHKAIKARSSSHNGGYYNGHKIYTGPRGGKYYINGNGKKTYI